MNRTIEIIIDPTGQPRLETKGFTGSACRDASRFLEEALGSSLHETLTPAFHQDAALSEVRREVL